MNFLNLKAILSLNGSGFALGLKRAESQSKQFAKEIKGEFARAFGTAAIVAYASKVVNLADNVIDLSQRLGISTKALQEWAYAAKKSGSDIETVTRFLEQLSVARERALGGDDKTLDSFERLGISRDDLSGLGLDDLGRKIGRTVQSGNVQELISALRDVGGRGVGELIPAMKEGIDEMADAAKKAGQVMSDETLVALKSLKMEALSLADAFLGPVASAIQFAGGHLRNILDLTRMTIKAYGRAKGVEAAGGSKAEVQAAFNAVVDAELGDMERRRRSVQNQIDALRASNEASEKPPAEPDVQHRVSGVKNIAERAARAQMERPQVNSWQQLGAAVRGANHDHVRDIAGNTKEALKKQDEIRKAIERFGAITGLNAAQED